ncbi:hypothetical protein GW7_07692, partial [Heterocephalus glaber]
LLFFFFETESCYAVQAGLEVWSCYVAQAGPELTAFSCFSLPSKCWDYR